MSDHERVAISVPVAPVSQSAHLPLEVVLRLEPRHAIAWRSMWNGLKAGDETTSKGKPITTPDQAMAWLLEQIGDRFDRLP